MRLLGFEHRSCLDLLAVYHLKHLVSTKVIHFLFFFFFKDLTEFQLHKLQLHKCVNLREAVN